MPLLMMMTTTTVTTMSIKGWKKPGSASIFTAVVLVDKDGQEVKQLLLLFKQLKLLQEILTLYRFPQVVQHWLG